DHQPVRRPMSTTPQLGLGWMEAVQVIQNRRGSVRLIAGKRTALRIFLVSGLGTSVDLGNGPGVLSPVDGFVRITSPRGSLFRRFAGARALPAGTHDRDQASSSAIVELPLGLLSSGTVRIDVVGTVRGHASTEPGFSVRARQFFTFTSSRPEGLI